MFTALICSLIAMACVAGNTYGPSSEDRSRPRNAEGSADTIVVARDAYLGPDGDDYWKGTTDSLVVDGVRSTRILIQADQAAIIAAIGSGTLANATLELTVQSTGAAWPAGGATVDAHRVLQHWTEAEVTWVCADGHEGWDMSTGAGSIWQTAHTARTTITNGQTGVVRLNVTADVAAFLSAPQSNHGWLIKRTLEGVGEPGRISFASREGAPEPRLIIEVTAGIPPIPDQAVVDDDLQYTVIRPGTLKSTYYRRLFDIKFRTTATANQITAFFGQYSAEIVGGSPDMGVYTVRVPDPGANWNDAEALRLTMQTHPGVESARMVGRVTPSAKPEGRYPSDGSGFGRSAWTTLPTTESWALRAVRAPLAWGCETGTYGSDPVRVGVLEGKIDASHVDLGPSTPTVFVVQPTAVDTFYPPDEVAAYLWHGTAVAGLITAAGDNGVGAAGVNWRTRLFAYSTVPNDNRLADDVRNLRLQIAPQILRDDLRVLNVSMEIYLEPGDSVLAEDLYTTFKTLLDRNPRLLVVKAAGDSTLRSSVEQEASVQSLYGIRSALMRLIQQGYSSRIIFATGLIPGNQYRAVSNYFTGVPMLAAPADFVGVLGVSAAGPPYSTETVLAQGTSFAAPLVSGVAAQLAAMDPSLTASQLASYALRGAQQPEQDSATGVLPPAADSTNWRVQGAPSPVYQLDAYGSLTLLSRERQGTPLCGNRAWVEGVNARVERASGDETIGTRPSPGGFLATYHGGRIVWLGSHYLRHTGPGWIMEAGAPPSDATLSGSTHSTMSLTHDRDSIVNPQWGNPVLTSGPLPIELWAYTVGLGRVVGQVPVALGANEKAYVSSSPSPLRNWILVSVSIVGTEVSPEYAKRAAIYRLPFAGGTATEIALLPDRMVYWLGIAEDGAEFAVATGQGQGSPRSPVFPVPDCELSFRSISTGIAARAISSPYVCNNNGFSGGFAPLRANRSVVRR